MLMQQWSLDRSGRLIARGRIAQTQPDNVRAPDMLDFGGNLTARADQIQAVAARAALRQPARAEMPATRRHGGAR